MRGGHWRRPTSERHGNLNENSDAAFCTTLKLVSAFLEARKMFIFVFLLKKAAKNWKPTY
jgi:hypothetical protein